MNEKKPDSSSEPSKERKKISPSTKTFIYGTIIWSSIFLIIPPIIYSAVKDWIIALSITGKVGIGFIAIALILLGAVGTPRATGAGAGMVIIDYEGDSDDGSTSIRSSHGINYLEILSIGRVWLLFWGLIYLLPYAFGIPFLP